MQATIIADNLTVKFEHFTAVDRVSFAIQKGEVFGLLGPNGSGKTTLIKTLCGLYTPSMGNGTVLEMDIRKNADDIKRSIGYMSQKFSLYQDLTVMENIDFYAGIYGLRGRYCKTRKEMVIEFTGIEDYLNRSTGVLSGGWKQRLALACAIIHEPEVVFLDEPTAGIDPVARRELWDILFKLAGQGVTFFVTTHYMDEAERCGRVGYIYYSKLIACGTIDELRAMPEVSPSGTLRLEMHSRAPSATLAVVKTLPYILESTIFGQALHVLADIIPFENTNFNTGQLTDLFSVEDLSGVSFSTVPKRVILQLITRIKTDLAKAGLHEVLIRPIIPSLEDVFVTLTKRIDNVNKNRYKT